MRRHLAPLLLVAAAPLAAAAQTAGTILFDGASTSPTINAAQCSGAGTQASDTILLSWTIKLENSITWPFNTSGAYRVYAANTDPGNTNPFCNATNGSGGSTQVTPTGGTPNATLPTSSATVTTSSLAAAAGFDCKTDATVYVCVLWFQNSTDTTPHGYAKGTALLKVAAPAQPTVASVTAGDGALNVRVSAPTTGEAAVTWRAKAVAQTPALDGVTHYSSKVAVDTGARVSGLVNGVPYVVTAFTYSAHDNESPESAPWATAVTPAHVQDLWQHYEAAGGRDSGGCAGGGAGPLALLSAAALLRLRRRS